MFSAAVLRALVVVLTILCCNSVVQAAHPGWEQKSAEGRFIVRLRPQADTITLGRFENWVVTVQDADGNAVYPARIGLVGAMPGHKHGMPGQPQVTEYLGVGHYRVEGMKFNMAGEWVFGLVVETPTDRDRVKMTIEIDY